MMEYWNDGQTSSSLFRPLAALAGLLLLQDPGFVKIWSIGVLECWSNGKKPVPPAFVKTSAFAPVILDSDRLLGLADYLDRGRQRRIRPPLPRVPPRTKPPCPDINHKGDGVALLRCDMSALSSKNCSISARSGL